jgi:disulfide bond formation protein DsbB
MTVQVYNPIVASLALISLALAVGIALSPALRGWVRPHADRLALAVASAATLGSLVYSQYFLFEPCRLCWYQRIAMYPLVTILAVGLWRRDSGVRWYVLPPAIIGLGVSIWHYLLQTFPSLSGSTGCSIDVPCNAKYVNEFGFASIPFMAGCGFLLIITLMTFVHRKETT